MSIDLCINTRIYPSINGASRLMQVTCITTPVSPYMLICIYRLGALGVSICVSVCLLTWSFTSDTSHVYHDTCITIYAHTSMDLELHVTCKNKYIRMSINLEFHVWYKSCVSRHLYRHICSYVHRLGASRHVCQYVYPYAYREGVSSLVPVTCITTLVLLYMLMCPDVYPLEAFFMCINIFIRMLETCNITDVWMSRVTHIWMSRVARMNESWIYTHQWVVQHTRQWVV